MAKQPVKYATLRASAPFNPEVNGLIEHIDPQEAEYRRVMGRPSPPPFKDGTIASEQWKFRGSKERPADVIARPNAKPKRKVAKPRARRKPVGA